MFYFKKILVTSGLMNVWRSEKSIKLLVSWKTNLVGTFGREPIPCIMKAGHIKTTKSNISYHRVSKKVYRITFIDVEKKREEEKRRSLQSELN